MNILTQQSAKPLYFWLVFVAFDMFVRGFCLYFGFLTEIYQDVELIVRVKEFPTANLMIVLVEILTLSIFLLAKLIDFKIAKIVKCLTILFVMGIVVAVFYKPIIIFATMPIIPLSCLGRLSDEVKKIAKSIP